MDLQELLEFIKSAIRTNLVKFSVKDEVVLLEAFKKIEAYQAATQPGSGFDRATGDQFCGCGKTSNHTGACMAPF